jgi:hypothetical protein
MNLHLSDIDELAQKVINNRSKKYFSEAIEAYRAGAYRASIMATWIAVSVDIIEKTREMGVDGDGAAREVVTEMDSIGPADIRNIQRFEGTLIEIAYSKLGLISEIEKLHLDRLKIDRNYCAHPNLTDDSGQYDPSPELTRAYLVQAAEYLLTKPPLKGKAIIDRIVKLVDEASFPSEVENARAVLLSNHYLGRVKPGTIRNLIVVLLKRLFLDESRISCRRPRSFLPVSRNIMNPIPS